MSCADSINRIVHPLFQAEDDGANPISALDFTIERIPFTKAVELNAAWHSILPRFGVGFVKRQPFPCFAAVYAGVIYAVAIWSNPAARNLPQQTWLELRRMAIADNVPKNTASRMLRIMRLLLHRRQPEIIRVVSYQSASVHTGTIYKADGWRVVARSKSDTWDRPGRSRQASQQMDDRIRWERPIVGPPECGVSHDPHP